MNIRQLTFCEKGYLHQTVPQNVVNWGLGNNGEFNIKDMPVEGQNGEQYPDGINFKVDVRSQQSSVRDLDVLINTYCNQGIVDCQIVLEKRAANLYDGVYDFIYTAAGGPDKFMGFGFEWMQGSKERYCNLRGEVTLPESLGKEIIQSSQVNTPLDLVDLGYGVRGRSTTNYIHPYGKALNSPASTLFINQYEIYSRSYVLRSISEKLAFDRDNVLQIEIELNVVTKRVRGSEILALFNKQRDAAVKVEEYNVDGTYNQLSFAEGVLWRVHDYKTNNSNDTMTLIWKKKVSFADITINTGAKTITISELV